MKLTIDTDQIKEWVTGAAQITLTPEAEAPLTELFKAQKAIEDAIEETKLKIQEAALAANPDFKTVHSDNFSVAYRAWGSRYLIDETRLNNVPKELYRIKTTLYPEAQEIEKYVDAHEGQIPLGIIEKEREKKISITAKKGVV